MELKEIEEKQYKIIWKKLGQYISEKSIKE